MLFWWSRGPPRGAAQPALPTYTTAHQGPNPILSQSLRQLWRWRRVWMRRCLSEQLSKLRHGRKTRNTGRMEARGRQANWKGEPRGRQGRGEGSDLRSRGKKSLILSSSQEDQGKSMDIPGTVCGCAGMCGCICYLTEIAQHLHHPYLIY